MQVPGLGSRPTNKFSKRSLSQCTIGIIKMLCLVVCDAFYEVVFSMTTVDSSFENWLNHYLSLWYFNLLICSAFRDSPLFRWMWFSFSYVTRPWSVLSSLHTQLIYIHKLIAIPARNYADKENLEVMDVIPPMADQLLRHLSNRTTFQTKKCWFFCVVVK